MRMVAPWAAAGVVGWALYRVGESFFEPAVFAAALCAACWPLAQRMRLGVGRRLSSLAVSVALSAGLALPACWAWSSAFGELDAMVEGVAREMSKEEARPDWQSQSKRWGVAAAMQAKRSPAWSARTGAGGAMPWGAVGLTGILLYFMLADGARALEWAGAMAGEAGGEQGTRAWLGARRAFCATAKGCLWFGMLSFMALWALFHWAGAPSPLAFAVAGACASMLPFVAPIMVSGVAAALFAPDNVVGPIALFLFGAGGLGVANNILRPRWVGSSSGLPMPAALIGMAGGALAWGPAGLLAGPAVVAGALALLAADGGGGEPWMR